jgi:hypothetical protein
MGVGMLLRLWVFSLVCFAASLWMLLNERREML